MTHDTSELVERLRYYRSTDVQADPLILNEAAITIEQQSAEIARLREALVIAEAPRCFSCGVKVTEPCPRGLQGNCGREHLGGTRAALEPKEAGR